MMGSEDAPKDGKVVAGSIFWAVLVYAVRLSPFFFLSLLGRHPPNPPSFPSFPSPSPPLKCQIGVVGEKNKQERTNDMGGVFWGNK